MMRPCSRRAGSACPSSTPAADTPPHMCQSYMETQCAVTSGSVVMTHSPHPGVPPSRPRAPPILMMGSYATSKSGADHTQHTGMAPLFTDPFPRRHDGGAAPAPSACVEQYETVKTQCVTPTY